MEQRLKQVLEMMRATPAALDQVRAQVWGGR